MPPALSCSIRVARGLLASCWTGSTIVLKTQVIPTIYCIGDPIIEAEGRIEATLAEHRRDVVIAHTGGYRVKVLSPDPILLHERQAIALFRGGCALQSAGADRRGAHECARPLFHHYRHARQGCGETACRSASGVSRFPGEGERIAF